MSGNRFKLIPTRTSEMKKSIDADDKSIVNVPSGKPMNPSGVHIRVPKRSRYYVAKKIPSEMLKTQVSASDRSKALKELLESIKESEKSNKISPAVSNTWSSLVVSVYIRHAVLYSPFSVIDSSLKRTLKRLEQVLESTK